MHDQIFDYKTVKKAIIVTKAINHVFRQFLLRVIKENKGCTVTLITKHADKPQAVVSAHLALLRKAGIVTRLTKGKNRHYFLNQDRVDKINSALENLIDKQEA